MDLSQESIDKEHVTAISCKKKNIKYFLEHKNICDNAKPTLYKTSPNRWVFGNSPPSNLALIRLFANIVASWAEPGHLATKSIIFKFEFPTS